MTSKKFYFYRILIAIMIGAIFSVSIVARNYIVPFVTLITTVGVILMMKRNVKDVLQDERDYEAAGKAARYAMTIFSVITMITIFALILFRDSNPMFETVASILAYAVCTLMIIYSFLYKYFQSDMPWSKNRTLMIFLAVILGSILVVVNLRLLSGEDGWICQNGEWVNHGHPDAPRPTAECVKK